MRIIIIMINIRLSLTASIFLAAAYLMLWPFKLHTKIDPHLFLFFLGDPNSLVRLSFYSPDQTSRLDMAILGTGMLR